MKKLFSLGVVLAFMAALWTPPALANVTFITKGQAKMGGLILGPTAVTSTGADLNQNGHQAASLTQVSTPATGSNATQFTFKDADGAAVNTPRSLFAYVSTSAGAHTNAVTSLVSLTNGSLSSLIVGKVILATTNTSGVFGVTLTAGAGSYYITFVLPNGKLATSSVLTVN